MAIQLLMKIDPMVSVHFLSDSYLHYNWCSYSQYTEEHHD